MYIIICSYHNIAIVDVKHQSTNPHLAPHGIPQNDWFATTRLTFQNCPYQIFFSSEILVFFKYFLQGFIYFFITIFMFVCFCFLHLSYDWFFFRFCFRRKNPDHQLNSTKKESKILSKSHDSGCLDDTLTELEAFTLGTTNNKKQTHSG